MSVRRHAHEFSAFSAVFGPYGRQDVHYHPCVVEGCDRVLVGTERECDGEPQSHHRETLKDGGGIVGRSYLERGEPVTVLIRWGEGGGPRNVLIRRADGTRVVRPFRGLRRLPEPAPTPAPPPSGGRVSASPQC